MSQKIRGRSLRQMLKRLLGIPETRGDLAPDARGDLELGDVVIENRAVRQASDMIDLGAYPELLLDDCLVESITGVSFRMHEPRRAETVIVKEYPWEGASGFGHVSVLRDGDVYRMYYRGYVKPPGYSWEKDLGVCYAESRDGIRWEKPPLGLFDWNGSTENNIVWKGGQMAPFIDARPGIPPQQRYKALAGNKPTVMLASPDGIIWRIMHETPLPMGIAIYHPEKDVYIALVRVNQRPRGHLGMAYSESADLRVWSDPVPLDFGDGPPENLYFNAPLPYFRAPHIHLGFPMRLTYLDPALQDGEDRTDVVLLFSRDGRQYSRRHRDAFLSPGPDERNWVRHANMMAWGILPAGETEMSMYVDDRGAGGLRRLALRTDGFVSLRTSHAGGEMVTRPLRFEGNRLVLNVATSAAGGVRVEIQDAGGKPLKGFALADCPEFAADRIAHVVSWAIGADVGALAGKPVRLRFAMRDADLYALRFEHGD